MSHCWPACCVFFRHLCKQQNFSRAQHTTKKKMSTVICLSNTAILKLALVCSSGSLRGLRASWHTCCSACFRETTENGSASVRLFPFSTSRALQKMSEWLTSHPLSHPQSSFSTIPSWFQVPPQREVRTAFRSRRSSDRVMGGSVNQVRIPLMPLLLFFFFTDSPVPMPSFPSSTIGSLVSTSHLPSTMVSYRLKF